MIVYVSFEVEDMCKVCKMMETTICHNWRDQEKNKHIAKALLKFLGSVIKIGDGIRRRNGNSEEEKREYDGIWG